MLQRRGFLWLIAAALAGLLPALMVASQAARHALEGAALEQLAGHAATLAAALQELENVARGLVDLHLPHIVISVRREPLHAAHDLAGVPPGVADQGDR